MKALCLDNYALVIGIDWADQKHDVCEIDLKNDTRRHTIISSRPEAIQQWWLELQQRFPDQQLLVICELKKGPLVNALLKYPNLTLVPVHPATYARYRKAFQPNGAKADASDAKLLAEMVVTHLNKFSAIEPESPAVRALAQLVESRRKLVQDRVDLTNSLTWHLKNYYPQVLDWVSEKDSYLFLDFIEKWPTLKHVQRARKKTLIDFMQQHNIRNEDLITRRIEAIKQAVHLTRDEGVIEPNQFMAETLCKQLRVLMQAIEQIDQQIKTRYATMADRKIFDSLPGAGPQLTHWRYNCPTFIRQTFVEWAGQTVRFSFWARAYYDQQKQKGKPHNTIIRSLAFKWIRIVFRCWQEGVPYDEAKYLQALRERGSPILRYAAQS